MEFATLSSPGWTVGGSVAARGRAFDRAGDEVDLAAAFASTDSFTAVAETAEELSGFFAAVVDAGDDLFLVCDHARTTPLYFTTDRPVRVGDTTPEGAADDAFDPVAASEFALTRYVTGGETVWPTVRSVRAGETVRVPRDDPSAFERRRYFRYRPTTARDGDDDHEALLDRMDGVLARVFDRVAAVAGDRPVAVPLSGGWDSRLVATMLAERDCEVVAFTFGRHGHADVEVSRDVADALGVRWESVEYTTDRWHDWYHSEERRAYHEYAFAGDALPFLAEWPAVRELRADGLLPADALVCPGHTVATPSERVPAEWLDEDPDADPGPETLVDHVLDEHYSLWEWDDPEFRATFAERVDAESEGGTADSAAGEGASGPAADCGPAAAAAYEAWEWSTRMATFTHGDLRLYDHFEYDWWLPLWDPDYVRFWESVPLAHRHGKALQREYTARKFAAVAGVDPGTARRTDRDWTPFDQLRRTLRTDPVAAVRGGFDDWLGVRAVPSDRWERWGNYPLGWYGVVPEAAADRFSAARNLYALRTLAALDLLSFDPPSIANPPLTRPVDLPIVGHEGG